MAENITNNRSSLASASMVLGIVGACISFIPVLNMFSLILGLLACIFGLIAAISRKGTKQAVAGLILGIISIIIMVIVMKNTPNILNQTSKNNISVNQTIEESNENTAQINAQNANINTQQDAEDTSWIWIVIVLLLFVGFCIYMIVITSNAQYARKRIIKQELDQYKASLFIVVEHIIGLPLSEGAFCKVFLCQDKIVIKSVNTGAGYHLSMKKILEANIKTEQEIQTNYVSSIGGAVGGAVLFGPLGAIVGGRTKKKTDKIIHSYLTITYNNDKENKVDYVSFDVTGKPNAQKIVDYCNKNCKRNTVTEL